MYKQLRPLYPGVIHLTEGRGHFRSCPPKGMYSRKAGLITTGTSIEVLQIEVARRTSESVCPLAALPTSLYT